ncbi:MAG: MATE family efflux transporter [Clostridia bacterium]|nr:MATE family efflux transporter [Clostridia bacterium]
MTFREKFIGDKAFYRTLLVLVLPLIIQQGITNFVSLLDNLMVGGLGTHPMSGVSIVNQLIFVFNLTIFGGLSGASIFGTQFFGVGDWKGMRDTFRFKMIFSVVVSVLAVIVFTLFSEPLLMIFLENETNTAEDIALTLAAAQKYFRIALWGLLPFAVVQTYAGTLRETGETVTPMIGGVIAIFVNLTFNYLLIFGKFGFPEMGVAGAALATVLSRFVELAYVVFLTHKRHEKYRFVKGAYRSLHIPSALVKKIAVTGTPLMLNEVLWSLGQTFINSNYASHGIVVIAATNISGTAWNLFCVIMFAMGTAVSILVGQRLGAGDTEGAVDVDNKLLFFTFVSHVLIGLLIIVCAPLVPQMYNVEPEVRALASKCLMVLGGSLPIHALIHCIYFTVRSGGKTVITFLFDCVYTWVVPAMLSFFLCRFTSLPIITIYLIVQFSDIIKLAIGLPMVKSGFWTKCVISDVREE